MWRAAGYGYASYGHHYCKEVTQQTCANQPTVSPVSPPVQVRLYNNYSNNINQHYITKALVSSVSTPFFPTSSNFFQNHR